MDQPPRFATDIKPLFRPKDVESMSFAFNLEAFEEVSENADEILARLRKGSMPCDGAWPAEHVDLFERWVRGGKQP